MDTYTTKRQLFTKFFYGLHDTRKVEELVNKWLEDAHLRGFLLIDVVMQQGERYTTVMILYQYRR